MAVIVSVAGEKRAEMLSWFSSITIIGNLLGAPLGGFLLTRLAGGQEPNLMHFHIVYGVVAALGMASLVIALWVMQGRWDSPRREHDKTLSAVWAQFRTGVRELLMDRRVLLTSTMEGIQNLSVGALEAFLYLCGVGVRILSVPGRVALGHTSCRDGSFQAAHGKNFRSAWSSESPVLGYVRMRGTLCAHPVVSEFHCAPRVGSNFRAW
jgi:MFS family permease